LYYAALKKGFFFKV